MSSPATLFLVATPIGHRDDLSLRAIQCLKQVACIACETPRHSQKLLHYHGITTPLTAYHQHNEQAQSIQLIRQLKSGRSIALISDAGTPGISDPGQRLVDHAHEADIPVSIIPGPCAAISALATAGFPTQAALFVGFLPATAHARQAKLRQLSHHDGCLMIYVSPHRLVTVLKDAHTHFGDRRACLAHELTKQYEGIHRKTLSEWCSYFETKRPRGEYVLIVEGAPPQQATEETVRTTLTLLLEHLPPSQACTVASQLLHQPKNRLYQWLKNTDLVKNHPKG